VRKKFLGSSRRKRNRGRSTRIDSWDRLELVIELIKSSLPVDMRIDLNHIEFPPLLEPLPYDPRMENSITIRTPSPVVAEVRVSLSIDETLAWLLPVQFCVDHLLRVEEVVAKITDAFWFLQGWTHVHGQGGRRSLRTQRTQVQHLAKSASKYLVQ